MAARFPLVTGLTIALAMTAIHAEAGDALRGMKTFGKKCGVCHFAAKGKHKFGPSLYGTYGRKSGRAAGYNYSPAMKNAGLTWDDSTLEKYLKNPRKLIRGTRMSFVGLDEQKDRADVIAYLKTLHEAPQKQAPKDAPKPSAGATQPEAARHP
jgi:cytochrome c